MQKALVSLLSHWRTVLCAENAVRLRADVAERFLPKEPALPSFAQQESRLQMEEEEGEGEGPPPAESLLLLTPDEELGSPGSGEARGSDASDAAPGRLRGRRSRSGNGAARTTTSPRADSAASKSNTLGQRGREVRREMCREDLYQWMKDQQREARESVSRKSPYTRGSEVNPMDLPLNIYFAPIYKVLLSLLLVAFSCTVVSSIRLKIWSSGERGFPFWNSAAGASAVGCVSRVRLWPEFSNSYSTMKAPV